MTILKKANENKLNLFFFILFSFIISSTFSFGLSRSYGFEFYAKDDSPFGTPLDVWVSNWWTWWVAQTIDEATPKPDGCLIYESDSMITLMDTVVSGNPHQVCTISSTQGIMIPMWTGWCDSGAPGLDQASYETILKCAREEINLGAVTSVVKLDGRQIAKLDEVSSMRGGTLDYKINSMDNVTEVRTKAFNITIPEDTQFPDQSFGTFRAAAHGWFVFLKPLPPGNHSIYYNVGVTGLGPNDHSSEITYDLKVQ
jgi:hypothetical protein